MEITVKEGKREFKIIAHIDSMIKSVDGLMEDYEEERYVHYGTSHEFGDPEFKYINAKEYKSNLNEFRERLVKLTTEEQLKRAITTFPRKKNGTFNRRNVNELASCRNCEVIHEWHNTWIYYVIKVRTFNDKTLIMEVCKKTDTPC